MIGKREHDVAHIKYINIKLSIFIVVLSLVKIFLKSIIDTFLNTKFLMKKKIYIYIYHWMAVQFCFRNLVLVNR